MSDLAVTAVGGHGRTALMLGVASSWCTSAAGSRWVGSSGARTARRAWRNRSRVAAAQRRRTRGHHRAHPRRDSRLDRCLLDRRSTQLR
jgi:hypothetical protein